MARPTLGVMALYLSGTRLEERAYFRRLFEQARKLGISMIVFTPEDVDSSGTRVHAWRYASGQGWYREWTPLPSLVYDRCRYQRTYRYKLLRRFRNEHRSLLYMSRPIALKWGLYQLLAKSKDIRPHLPATITYKQPADLYSFLERYPLLYLKPIDGTGGRGVIRIERMPDGTYLVGARDRSRRILPTMRMKAADIPGRLTRFDLKEKYLIQQGIQTALKDGRVHDFRLLMQKDGRGRWSMTGCAGRVGAKRSITSNLHGGGTAMPLLKLLRTRFSSEQRVQAIVQGMERLGYSVVSEIEKHYGSMTEMALDIAVDPSGRVWLLEVNPKPSREVFREIGEKATYAKAIRRPLEYALWLVRRHRGGTGANTGESDAGPPAEPGNG